MTTANHGLPRAFDVLLASVFLAAMTPVLAAVAAAVALTSGVPVLFRHERVGRGGRHFRMLKFRTMRTGGRGPEVTASADTRITSIGRLLRKSKLDELPELWNVMRGDMSLIGPRPESPAYVDLSDARWRRVLEVRPGLTDWMTLRLRNEEELLTAAGADPDHFYRTHLVPYKLRGYLQYQSMRSWKSDLALLASTAIAVARPATAPPPSVDDVVAGRLPCAPDGPRRLAALADEIASAARRLGLRRSRVND